MQILTKSLISLSLLLPLIACDDDETVDDTETQSLVDVAAANGNFTILVGALEATGLDITLGGEDDFTVFAPTDEAFGRLPAGVLDSLDAATLEKILTYHVVPGSVTASTVVTLDSATTAEGADVAIQIVDGGVVINGTTQVTTTDVLADNGVIHILDSVLLPPDIAFPGDIVDAALAYPIFDTLAGAVVAAELAETLKTDNEGAGFTVFAPQNGAFAELGIDLGTLSTEELSNVLLYHTVGATVDSAAVVGLDSATTLQGTDVSIEVSEAGVTLNENANVVRVDLRTTNGIIHVIDAVLLPAN
jgi:transforming growth factor-beta-induced protein